MGLVNHLVEMLRKDLVPIDNTICHRVNRSLNLCNRLSSIKISLLMVQGGIGWHGGRIMHWMAIIMISLGSHFSREI